MDTDRTETSIKYDVFISWRQANISQSVVEALKKALLEGGLKGHYFGETESEIQKKQEFAIEQSRMIIVLLGPAGLTRAEPGGSFNPWSYQHLELEQLQAANHKTSRSFQHSPKELDALPPGEREEVTRARNRLLIPCFTVCLWYDDKTGKRLGDIRQFADQFLPKADDPVRRTRGNSGHVRDMLKDEDPYTEIYDMSIHAKGAAVDLDASPPWQTETIRRIKLWAQEHEVPLIGGIGVPDKGQATDKRRARERIEFNAIGYSKVVQTLWTQERRLNVDADVLIPIAFTGVEGTDPTADTSDAASFVANTAESLWVSGEPGAGKSTLLHEAALREAARFERGDEGARCPFFVPLAALCKLAFPEGDTEEAHGRRPDLSSLLADYLNTPRLGLSDLGISAETLKVFFAEVPSTLYFDAVDAVVNPSLRQLILQLIRLGTSTWPDVHFVFSCRAGYQPRESFGAAIATIDLEPLTTDQVNAFVEKYAHTYYTGDKKRQAAFQERFTALRLKLEQERGRIDTVRNVAPAMRTPLLVAIVCYLLRKERNTELKIGSVGTESLIMAELFKEIASHSNGAAERPFDIIGVLTALAKFTLFSSVGANREIPLETVKAAVNPRGELDTLTGAEQDREIDTRSDILRNDSIILRSDEARPFEFIHQRFAEHLVAIDITESCKSTDDIRGQISALLPGNSFQTAQNGLLELIGLVCAHIDRHHDVVTATALLAEACDTTTERIDRGDFEGDAGAGAAALAFVSAITGLEFLAKRGRDKTTIKRIEDAMVACFLRHRNKWQPYERESIVAAMAACEDGLSNLTLWSRVATGETGTLIDSWTSVPGSGFSTARGPVLVRDYRDFLQSKQRYDDEFWPQRTAEERAFARDHLIPFAQGGKTARLPTTGPGGVLSGHLVLGDLTIASHRASGMWPEQSRYPGRPVVNITRVEASAYARWLSARATAAIELPRFADWDAVVNGFGLNNQAFPWGDTLLDASGAPGGNVGRAALDEPSTLGVFAPLSSAGLIDFGSNVFIWVAGADRTTEFYTGAYFHSPDREAMLTGTRRVLVRAGTRHDYIGFWLIKRG